ncbi:MAG: rod shape-determining protein MreD [Boseongicola sp.]|nr:MAG: rod shape-determining protein MreD [Boseongicola sp.]
MVEAPNANRWTYHGLFLGLAALIIFAKLLPLHPGPGRVPGPDVLLLVTFAWLMRRPDFVPLVLPLVVFFWADTLFVRPLGLWTALVLVAVEFLRAREASMREQSFLLEWLSVSTVITAMFLANAMILAIFVVEQPSLGSTLIRLLATVLMYPIVVALAARAFGIRKISPGEVDHKGRRR